MSKKDDRHALDAANDEIHRLQILDQEYGQLETHIIMSDPDFDGDSDHATPLERLMASVDRMRAKADKLAMIEATEPSDNERDQLMRGYGIGALLRWANDPTTKWKSHRQKKRFVKQLNRAYLHFRTDPPTEAEAEAAE